MYTFGDTEEGTQWSRKDTTFIMEDGGVVGDGGADGAEHKEWLAVVDLPCILKK